MTQSPALGPLRGQMSSVGGDLNGHGKAAANEPRTEDVLMGEAGVNAADPTTEGVAGVTAGERNDSEQGGARGAQQV